MAGINVAATQPALRPLDSRSLLPILKNQADIERFGFAQMSGSTIAAADAGMAVLAVPQDAKQRMLAVVRPGGLDESGHPRVAAAVEDDGNDMAAVDVLKTKQITYYVHE